MGKDQFEGGKVWIALDYAEALVHNLYAANLERGGQPLLEFKRAWDRSIWVSHATGESVCFVHANGDKYARKVDSLLETGGFYDCMNQEYMLLWLLVICLLACIAHRIRRCEQTGRKVGVSSPETWNTFADSRVIGHQSSKIK